MLIENKVNYLKLGKNCNSSSFKKPSKSKKKKYKDSNNASEAC